jgi:polyisoprenyl-phosphate glycosyltransferase
MKQVKSIAAVVPAYNEYQTVGLVVKALKSSSRINEVVVVDDGSEDRTCAIAEAAGAKAVKVSPNQGKGEAMSLGVSLTDAEVILFVDADFMNLTPEHIEAILKPIIEDEYDMVTGVVDRGKGINKIMESVEDPFAGMRALRRDIWEKTPQKLKDGYLIDAALHVTAKRMDSRVKNIVLNNLKQVTKIKKHGLAEGTWLYLKMWGEIAVKAFMFIWIK